MHLIQSQIKLMGDINILFINIAKWNYHNLYKPMHS